jgi:hypothetical protein
VRYQLAGHLRETILYCAALESEVDTAHGRAVQRRAEEVEEGAEGQPRIRLLELLKDEEVWVWLPACLPVCLSVCLPACLPACLTI